MLVSSHSMLHSDSTKPREHDVQEIRAQDLAFVSQLRFWGRYHVHCICDVVSGLRHREVVSGCDGGWDYAGDYVYAVTVVSAP